MFLSKRLRHKHDNKHSIYSRYSITALIVTTIVAIFPTPALALETSLTISPVPTILNQMQSLTANIGEKNSNQNENNPTNTSYTNAIVSTSSPITTKGDWDKLPIKTKLAYTRQPLTTPLVLQGQASYYSWAGCLGCNALRVMANGEQLNDNALTMAIGADKSHLVGYSAHITNLANGKTVTARITDTGGFYQEKYGSRVADLSLATKQAIGMGGLGQVRVEVF